LSLNSLLQLLSLCWGCKGNPLYVFKPNIFLLFQKINKSGGKRTVVIEYRATKISRATILTKHYSCKGHILSGHRTNRSKNPLSLKGLANGTK